MSASEFESMISASVLRLRTRSAYFATLVLFAPVVAATNVNQSATDGERVYVNPDYFATLRQQDQDRLILHQVLHAALLHIPRRGNRNPQIWNTACDIVLNGIVSTIEGIGCDPLTQRDPELEALSVEEVYELLVRDPSRYPLTDSLDLLEATEADRSGLSGQGGFEQETRGTKRNAVLEAHWRNARHQADLIALMVAQGSLPSSMRRELSSTDPENLDWRTYLWRYLVQTPTDFVGFDRRFISRGLYLDALAGESLQVFVAVDTSGSIDERHLKLFMDEVQGILRSYPHISCDLFYVDAEAHGPFQLTAYSPIPEPIGGGGTDFRPFFQALEGLIRPHMPVVAVYLTDGYGSFPAMPPDYPFLWVVVAGGLDSEAFPFGEAIRLLLE
ncbi:vWA domain-containing protein [Herpetosiphon llansteffanensis]|uniref:vWA domain-containing protein n=1 Tax=Herpetosiphon llansteffanensis TaxID=2094568 RepID=UPI000D7BD6D0|nr:VWA-like domain-containing protein [Herpetosiphon llansteffanensis]